MPSLKRGFLFTYFDKIICGVVGLGLLLGIVYALNRLGPLPAEIAPENVSAQINKLQQKLRQPSQTLNVQLPELTVADQVPPAPAVRPGVFIWPLPVEYPPAKVGLNKTFVLQFKAPLGKGTVTVQRNEVLLDIVEHPVEGDYSKVRVKSKSWPGEAAVVGYEGDRAHIYTVIVDPAVNKTAYPPTIRVTSRQGAVSLELVEDDRIAEEEVEVLYYEIWRRDWSDPLGDYELINEVDLSGRALRGATAPVPARRTTVTPRPPAGGYTGGRPPVPAWARTGAVPPGMVPGTMPGAPRATAAPAPAEKKGIPWQDNTVEAGRYYSYKARAVGVNTFPTEGEFCDPVIVEVLSDIDFRFTLTSRDMVRFEVVKAAGNTVRKQNFWVRNRRPRY